MGMECGVMTARRASTATKPRAATTAIYVRVSRDKEGGGLAVERQEEASRQLIEARGLPPVFDVYTDNDVSATDRRKVRKDYKRLLADMRAGLITHVVAWHTDRLHRQPRELEDYIDAVVAAGIQTVCVVSGALDLNTPGGQMAARQLVAMAKYESDLKSQRLTAKHLQLAQGGAFNGGSRRWGYEVGMIRQRPAEARVIRQLAAAVIEGRSLKSLAADLNDKGVPTPKGCQWRGANLGTMLKSPHLAGLRTHKGRVVGRATWRPILDRSTWEAVRVILNDPTRLVASSNVRKYLLTGLARCGTCGGKIRGRETKGRPSYMCESTAHVHRPVVMVDGVVRAAVVARLAMVDASGALQDDNDTRTFNRLQGEVDTLQARLDGLADDYADGTIDKPRMARMTARITTRLDELAARQSAAVRPRGALKGLVGQPDAGDLFDALPLDRQRAVIDALGVVYVDPAARRGARFDANLVRVVWHADKLERRSPPPSCPARPPTPDPISPGAGVGALWAYGNHRKATTPPPRLRVRPTRAAVPRTDQDPSAPRWDLRGATRPPRAQRPRPIDEQGHCGLIPNGRARRAAAHGWKGCYGQPSYGNGVRTGAPPPPLVETPRNDHAARRGAAPQAYDVWPVHDPHREIGLRLREGERSCGQYFHLGSPLDHDRSRRRVAQWTPALPHLPIELRPFIGSEDILNHGCPHHLSAACALGQTATRSRTGVPERFHGLAAPMVDRDPPVVVESHRKHDVARRGRRR